MKKIVLILICIFTLSLVGCNKKVNNAPVVSHKKAKLNYPLIRLSDKVLDNTSDITEDDNFIYYADKNGISKVDKKSGKNKLILKRKNVVDLVLSGEYIYFSVTNEQNMDIFCIDKKGKKYFNVFYGEDIPDRDQVPYYSFIVSGNKMYIRSGAAVYLFKMADHELKRLCDDVEEFQIRNGFIYYCEHGQKTFTIYKKSLKSMKTEILLGNGVSKPNKNIYDNFIFAGNDLYYTKRLPDSSNRYFTSALYKYNGGNEINIRKENEVIDEGLIEYKGSIYFVASGSDDKSKLMRYCLKDGNVSQAACISDDDYSIDTIKIVNGYWYYNTKNNKIRCVKLAK